MSMRERALLFPCEGEELIGVITESPQVAGDVGVLVIVGGPQYRAGSHRQFVLLARLLAGQGVPCMRFDYRGMGDSTGMERDFESVDVDVRAAIDAFVEQVPTVKRVVLWGLCDGASAACFYAPGDDRVAGMVLLNPWVKTVQGEARTFLRHYYLKRVLDVSFWKKLLGGSVSLGRSVGGVLDAAKAASSAETANSRGLPERVGEALHAAGRPLCVILSGNDYIAREFDSACTGGVLQQALESACLIRLDAADHTFSSEKWRDEVAKATVDWVCTLG